MSLHISISPQAEALLRKRAEAAGKSPDALASEILELGVSRPRTLEELSGPLAEEFHRSGMTDDEHGDFLEREKHAMRAERRKAS